jgi:hypothetical protein
VAWPVEAEIEATAASCAREQLAVLGHPYPGLVRVLGGRVIACVARARALIDAPAVELLGAEVAGSLVIEAGETPHALEFRADLVERIEGGVRLSDYKTGKPVSQGKRESTRAKHFEQRVARGELLQAVAYALASGGAVDIGRYLFLDPSLRSEIAQASFVAGTPAAGPLEAAFRGAVSTLDRAWDAGVFPPRLSEVQNDEVPMRCSWCDLSSACLQGEPDMRQRQRDAVAAARTTTVGELAELEARHLRLWDLPLADAVPDTSEQAS